MAQKRLAAQIVGPYEQSSGQHLKLERDFATAGRGSAVMQPRLIREEDGAHYMAMHWGHCAALRVVALAFVCSVHERRPAVCREFNRGHTRLS